MRFRFSIAMVLIIALAGCKGGASATPAGPAAGDAVIDGTGITIDGKLIPIPFTTAQIVAVLEPPSRSVKHGDDTILTWDDRGMLAKVGAADHGRSVYC